ncbi:hypothetical protein CN514_00745 [Bacillus sp. AFS001701]|uniref:hypothetical protein n=1 Tax=unclassified Bacillus (in: firmicutes) TaxID=185979 RepID=UPI000BECFB41|nr:MULTISPECIES: hypothetical protein [unclassified Bacillus (in: firmicutes)]PEC49623.1 hypothetical protein CON00_10115 [Bacillus sp. AFS096315]PET77558.1 hypothetical protein CN514_00745 [Bacillus sp. AFS001701]
MKIVKGIIFYSLPFILTVIAAFQYDILKTLDLFNGYLLVAIFTFGIPILLFCSPYALYFFILLKLNKISKKGAKIAFVLTLVGFIGVIVGVEILYKPIEKQMYFNEQTTKELGNRSLKQFKKDTGLDGEIEECETTSGKGEWSEENMTGIEERRYTFVVIPKDSSKQVTRKAYIFTYKHGDWKGV